MNVPEPLRFGTIKYGSAERPFVTSPVSRAGALAVIGALSVLAPMIGAGTALLFAVIGLAALLTPEDTRLFKRLADPHDRKSGRLRTLGGFVLAIAVLAVLGTVDAFGLSAVVFAMAVLLVTFGQAGEVAVRSRGATPFASMLGFLAAGILGGLSGYGIFYLLPPVDPAEPPALALFLVVVGVIAAGLYRSELMREDPIEIVGVGLLLWFFAGIGVAVDATVVLVAVLVTLALGLVAFRTGTVTVAGMLSGTLLALVTFVVGGFGWFAMLAAFFVVGGLSTKYRYEEKVDRGVAESDEGRRGTANVLSNGLVPLLLVVGWAATSAIAGFEGREPFGTGFLLAFGGGVATAIADTLSSEIGSLQDNPRLITSFEPVPVGTDGAITSIGSVAGASGSFLIAVMAFVLFAEIGVLGATLVFVAGVGGMFADSLLGATLEGELLANDGVNLLATAIGAMLGGGIFLLVTGFSI